MRMRILNLLDSRHNGPLYDQEHIDILRAVNQAHAEWVNAQNYFNSVSEPELVDYAIYNLEAARKKYMYMLKQAKLMGVAGIQTLQYFVE